ncbi:MAG: hypothetical protein K6G12_10655 [Lachnospiraceae bacterium]|nr:hypothetical protein [Lachnospiraceae bacterium]
MAWKSIIPDKTIGDIRQDRKGSAIIEQYRVSKEAVYFNGQYLPLSAITALGMVKSSFTPAMSCGKGIPVYKVRMEYGAEKPLILMVEKEKNAKRMVELILESNPDIVFEEKAPV